MIQVSIWEKSRDVYLGYDSLMIRLMAEIPNNQLRLVVYPIIYEVLYIPGGAGVFPSHVLNHIPL